MIIDIINSKSRNFFKDFAGNPIHKVLVISQIPEIQCYFPVQRYTVPDQGVFISYSVVIRTGIAVLGRYQRNTWASFIGQIADIDTHLISYRIVRTKVLNLNFIGSCFGIFL